MNKSLLTISTNFDMKINNYDIISLSNEINSNNYNDRKKTNKIIQNEFSSKQHILKKKRNFNAFSIEHTQLHQIDKINNIIEDLYTLDTMSLVDYFKNEILINNNNNDNKSILNDDVDILEYINYANMFINPKITKESYGDIYYLSEHLKNQFQDLQNLSLFDVNWVSVNTLVKIAKISARINLRNKVIKEDIIKGYFITKEFLQQNFVYLLMNKKEKMRGKKAKMNFLIEKLRQFVSMNGKKITMEEIMEFGNIAKHECNELVERLNYEGILIKLNAEDYQITIK
jgi:DNA replicative helicase MCM subunit Mcm2 (Cdc46/Mcm family)